MLNFLFLLYVKLDYGKHSLYIIRLSKFLRSIWDAFILYEAHIWYDLMTKLHTMLSIKLNWLLCRILMKSFKWLIILMQNSIVVIDHGKQQPTYFYWKSNCSGLETRHISLVLVWEVSWLLVLFIPMFIIVYVYICDVQPSAEHFLFRTHRIQTLI